MSGIITFDLKVATGLLTYKLFESFLQFWKKKKKDFILARQLGRVSAERWALGCLDRPGKRRCGQKLVSATAEKCKWQKGMTFFLKSIM